MHNYITSEASSESVKFRKPYFVSYYKRSLAQPGKKNVLAIACGPAVEVQEIVGSWKQADLDRLHVTLFDLDREALEHAQSKIFEKAAANKKNISVEFVNANVKTFLSRPKLTGRYNLIYSGGLFDYLDNETCTALVTKLSTMLASGGDMVIGNFTKDNSTKAFCHLLTKWTLIHKTPDEILGWAKNLSDCTYTLEYDEGKINAFLVVTKN